MMDTTGLCFICDEELNDNNRVHLTTTRAHMSGTSLPETLAGVLGEEHFVVILNNNDYACKNCALQLDQVDRMEVDLKLVKNIILTSIKRKYGLLVPDGDVQVVKVDKEDLSDESPSKVSNLLKPNESSNTLINNVKKGLEFLLIQNKPQQVQIPQQVPMPTRSNAMQPGEPIINENATTILTPVAQNTMIYRCLICNNRYYNQDQCAQHVQRDHKKPTLNKLEKQEE